MRRVLFFFGYLLLIGSIIDTAILCHGIALIFASGLPLGIGVEPHIRVHLPFLAIFLDFAYWLLPDDLVARILALPVVLIYPIRITISILIGRWALSTARKMGRPNVG